MIKAYFGVYDICALMFFFYINISMENKEENSTALLNASVKVEICWGE